MTSLKSQAKKLIELAAKATQGSWWAHAPDDYGPEHTVRAGFFRWLKITDVEDRYEKNVAHPMDDANYFSAANPTTITALMERLLLLEERNEKLREALQEAVGGLDTGCEDMENCFNLRCVPTEAEWSSLKSYFENAKQALSETKDKS